MPRRIAIRLTFLLLGFVLVVGYYLLRHRTPAHAVELRRILSTNGTSFVAEFRILNFYKQGLWLPPIQHGSLSHYILESSQTNHYITLGTRTNAPAHPPDADQLLEPGQTWVFQASIEQVQPPWRLIIPFKAGYASNSPSTLQKVLEMVQSQLHLGRESRPTILSTDWVGTNHPAIQQ